MDPGPPVCIGIPLARKPVLAVFLKRFTCARVLEIKLSTIKIRDTENGGILGIR
jgi:hypothetical protein